MSNFDPNPYKIPEDMPKREIVLKLGQMITNRMGRKITYEDAEYWGLQGIVNDEMAEVALKMEVRKPKTLAQIDNLTGKDPEYLEKLLFEMCMVGLIE